MRARQTIVLLLAATNNGIPRVVTGETAEKYGAKDIQETRDTDCVSSKAKDLHHGVGVADETKLCQNSDEYDERRQRYEEPSSLRGFMRALKELGTSWNNVLKKYLDIVRNSEGTNLRGDVYVTTFDDALTALRAMVDDKKRQLDVDNDDDDINIWNFRAAPYKTFGKTLDDVFLAFLRWSSIDGAEDDRCDVKGDINKQHPEIINVSKAFRRLESYAEWIRSSIDDGDVVDNYLVMESVTRARGLIYSRVTHDVCGRAVWWLDLAQTDFDGIRELPDESILLLFVWLSHLIMFDDGAQRNGIVFFDSLANIGFMKYMTMLPLNVGLTVDQFMICVIPLKTKLLVFMNMPFWFSAAYGLLKVFLPQRMKSRVEMSETDEKFIEEMVGMGQIPLGFDGFEGSIKVDLIAEFQR